MPKSLRLFLLTLVVALASLALPRLLAVAQHLRPALSTLTRTQHTMATQQWKNVVVVGGSYVGLSAAKELAEPGVLPEGYRVLVVEKHSRE